MMKRVRNHISGCLLIVLLIGFTACRAKRPQSVITDARMENILYDYHLAKAMGDELSYSDAYKRVLYIEAAFKKNGVTQAQFDSSMVWFARNPEVLGKIYEQVNIRLKAEREVIENLIAVRDNKPRTSQPGDSVDVWAWQRVLLLTGMPLDNKYTFILPSDSNFNDRDTLRWNVGLRFAQQLPDSSHAPVIAMQVQYVNDSLIGSMQRAYRSGMYTMSLSSDTLGAIKEVRGSIYYPAAGANSLLLADTLSLMRYHATDSLTVQHADSLAVQHADSSVVPKKEAVKTGSPSVGTKNTQSPAVRVRDERILKPIEHGGEIQRTPQQ